MTWVVKNEGTAEFRGAHSVRVEFQVENTETGEIQRRRKTMRVERKTQQEKKRCIREFREELETELSTKSVTCKTFSEYASEWLAQREADKDIRPRTLSRDRGRVRTIEITLGNKPLIDITRADVKNFQAAIMTADENGHAPTVSGRPLSE